MLNYSILNFLGEGGLVKQKFISNTIMFTLNLVFVMFFQNIFGATNKMVGIVVLIIGLAITEKDLTVMSDQLEDSMGQAFYLFWGFATLIYIIVIYILAKMIIEKNKQSISMIKILGYTDKEVSSLYNIATAIIVIASMIICVPISAYIIKYIYYVMMKDFNGWLDYYIAPWIYPGMVLIGVVCYFVVHIIQMKKIKKIPMEQALKNVE